MIQQILAIGGGGLNDTPADRLLDTYLLKLANTDHPKICFLPQASAESSEYINMFYQTFTELGAIPSWLSLFGRVPRQWAVKLLEQDIIYVGGGNTRSMLALWREWGVDNVLQEASRNGTVLAGVSAGAICWFEECVTDSIWPLGTIKGLGYVKGSACPHYDGEAERRPTYMQMVKTGETIPGLALQDYTAAHYVDGELKQIVTALSDARAYRVLSQDGDVLEEELKATYLG